MSRLSALLLAVAAAGCGAPPPPPPQGTFRTNAEAMEAMKAREPSAPKAGQAAPDFDLVRLDGAGRVRLSDLRGKAPVVLLFGSYT